MKKDFHYYLVYALLNDNGFNKNEAAKIAYASQYVDDCNEQQSFDNVLFKNEIQWGDQLLHGIITQTMSIETLNTQNQYYVLIPFHFIPGNNPAKMFDGKSNRYATMPATHSVIADEIFDDALKTNNPYRIGITLHAIADTFSHQNFLGLEDDWNSVYPWYSPYSIVPNIGHAEVGDSPDLISDDWTDKRYAKKNQKINNANRTREAVEYIFKKLYAYKKPNNNVEQSWEQLKPEYERFILGPENKRDDFDYDDRIKEIMKYLNLNKKYDRSAWLKSALTYNKKEMSFETKPNNNFMKSDYWQFQVAAQSHISSVLEKMSKHSL